MNDIQFKKITVKLEFLWLHVYNIFNHSCLYVSILLYINYNKFNRFKKKHFKIFSLINGKQIQVSKIILDFELIKMDLRWKVRDQI